MFGLLNPLALWLLPLLAAPLMIHFLGRREPKLRDFPSLIPVRGRLTQAMQRHRLKNWLQLLLRTLALLFLLLAAANPLWRSRHGLTPPAAAGLLIHNGAYGAIPEDGETVLGSQQKMQAGLDSLTSGRARAERLFPGISTRETSARFGSYPDALSRLLAAGSGTASFHLYVPVFDWRDLEACRDLLARALRQDPHLHLILTEYPRAREQLSPFSGFYLGFLGENIATLKTAAPSSVSATAPVLWTPSGESSREIPVAKGSVEIQVPISWAGWLNGEISLPPPAGDRFAFPSLAVSARIPPPATLCHVGNAFVSLASLGRGGLRSRIKSFADAQELGSEPCDFLYLADPKNTDAALLERAAEIIRNGGKVILDVGRNADLSLLNRNLLEPLGVGRLAELKQHDPLPVKPNPSAFAALGMRVGGWREPGTVKAQIALLPDSGVTILLAAEGEPILIHRKIGKGSLLLWTTDVDDPDWTDLGLGPWVALIHQSFIGGSWNTGAGTREIASDSVLFVPASEPEEVDQVRVTDPLGSPFPRVERDPDGWRVGPFDRLGLYRIDRSGRKDWDTSWLAVGLDPSRLGTAPETDAEARERFLSALGGERARVTVLKAGDGWQSLYGGFRLKTWMLAAAALLLFLEAMVSLRLRPMPFKMNAFGARRD